MTHGARIYAALVALMRRLQRKPSEIEAVHEIDAYLAANAVPLKKPRASPSMPRTRTRDAIFDTLARIDGQDLTQMTRKGASRIAGAKKEIVEVMPGATVDQIVDEIERRASAYRRKHPGRELTAMALVSWWAELGGGPMTKQAVADPYIEPACDWRPVLCAVLNIDADHEYARRGWLDVDLAYRRQVLEELSRKVVPISNGDGWVKQA